MYKLLLCWRYLLTRYLALVCIVSVMLGVATLIVVNSVMSGFSTKLRDRLHGLLSDVVIEADDYDGFADPDGKMDRIRAIRSSTTRIEAMTPTLEIFAMLQFTLSTATADVTRPVRLIGIDPEGRAQRRRLRANTCVDQDNAANPSFELSAEGQARYRAQHPRHGMHRPDAADRRRSCPARSRRPMPPPSRARRSAAGRSSSATPSPTIRDPDTRRRTSPTKDICIAATRRRGHHHHRQRRSKLTPVYDRFVVCRLLQVGDERVRRQLRLRAAGLPAAPARRWTDRVTSIQIKLKDYDATPRRSSKRLQKLFRRTRYQRADLGRQAGAAAGRHRHREGHPQRAAVPDHRAWPASASWPSSR